MDLDESKAHEIIHLIVVVYATPILAFTQSHTHTHTHTHTRTQKMRGPS